MEGDGGYNELGASDLGDATSDGRHDGLHSGEEVVTEHDRFFFSQGFFPFGKCQVLGDRSSPSCKWGRAAPRWKRQVSAREVNRVVEGAASQEIRERTSKEWPNRAPMDAGFLDGMLGAMLGLNADLAGPAFFGHEAVLKCF